MGVGTTIMQLRSRAGLTQEELANRLDPPLSHAAVAAWEAGKSKPRYKVLSQLSMIFNVPMSQLLDGEQVPRGAVMPTPSDAALPGVAGVIQAPADVVARHPSAWFFPVDTSCMDRAYPVGCLVLVDPDMQPRRGSAVIVDWNGECILRRYHAFTDTVVLSSDSTEPLPDVIAKVGTVQVLGTVVWYQAREDER